ncbi:MAG: UDP-N-acetylmuramoyl-tripeptide--D-alanyl-D-alanine ligase [Oscillospiraceae bacterium]|nr:UDP-N-acetylmuramoyl-tripeptide--D-alanyl-D-alanine ligase [Oscillospiraceae bacterium]
MEQVYLSQLLKNITVPKDDCIVSSVVVDSRKVEKNSIFLAIKGERVNGEDYAAKAVEAGACFVLTENYIADVPADKQCTVKNILNASIQLGANFRELYDITVVGVTGSVGKTSTKDFVWTALSPFAQTVRSLGNHNNEIGMPQTIFGFTKEDRFAILEMGMDDLGDVHKLSVAAKPRYAVISCIGVSHLEKLKTQENILKAKLEICDGMDPDGVLVLNGDDKLLNKAVISNPKTVKYFAVENKESDVVAKDIVQNGLDTAFTICDKTHGEIKCTIPVVGVHNVMNALSAYTVVTSMGFDPQQTADNLKHYVPSGMRGKVVAKDEVTFIEDCYNASPDSMRAAVNTVCSIAKGRKICVFGDMLELGSDSHTMHKGVGEYAKAQGVDIMLCYGSEAKYICDGFGDALLFDSKEALAQHLKSILQKDDAVIFKASRGMAFEEIINKVY